MSDNETRTETDEDGRIVVHHGGRYIGRIRHNNGGDDGEGWQIGRRYFGSEAEAIGYLVASKR